MEEALRRLKESIAYLKSKGQIHKQQDIADTLEMAKGHLSDAVRGGRYFTEGFLRRFAKAYSEYINEDYLINGVEPLAKPSLQTRPYFPLTVAAGFTGVPIGSVSLDQCEYMPIVPGVEAYDFSISVEGDSMAPLINNGDTLLCKWLDELRFTRKGIYVIDTNEGAVVKKVERVGNSLRCISLNPEYPPFMQPLDTILRVAQVRSLIRNL